MGQFSPSCACCGCTYTASDGNEYSDDFTTLDPGWIANQCTIDVVSGELEVDDPNTGTIAFAYRDGISVTGSDYLVIVEAIFLNQQTGLLIGNSVIPGFNLATPPFRMRSDSSGNIDIRVFGTNHGDVGTFIAGQKFTIKLQALGGTDVRACFFVDEELLYEEVGEVADPSTLNSYGFEQIDNSGAVIAYFDDFSLHVGNP